MITATTNAQVKHVIALKKKAKLRREEGVYLVEGIKMFCEIEPADLVSVYFSESFVKEHRELCEQTKRYCKCETVLGHVFDQMSDTQTPQGVLAVVKQKHYTLEDMMGKASLLMILENIQDPGNLGTIFRSAEAAGVTGIIMSEGTVDVYNNKVIRSTMGAFFRVPFLYTQDLAQTCKMLKKERQVRLFAAHLHGSAFYDQADYKGSTGFLIGNESQGLTEEISALADERILIPMLGKVESLNAGVAASLLAFEAARQRRS